MKKPNVLIIHTDEHVSTFLGCMGNSKVQTPHIDKLAGEGVFFQNAYTCNGVCIPSRGTLLTGRYPIAHSVTCNEIKLPESEVMMSERFKDAGYATGYFGKTHFGRPDEKIAEYGWMESFLFQEQYNNYLKENGLNIHYPEGKEIRRPDIRYWNIGRSNIPLEHYFEKVIADHAIDFIKRHKEKPFLCFVGNIAPHGPLTPPAPYDTMYKPDELELAPRSETELENKPPEFVKWVTQNQKYVNEKELKIYMAFLYGLITLVDDQVGRLVEALKENGIFDDTLVIFTSDHGDFSSAYGILGKSWCMDDRLMKVPLVMRYPSFKRRGAIDSLTENVDILPTVLDLAGVEIPERVHGESMMPFLKGETDSLKEEVYGYNEFNTSTDHLSESMVRWGKWKFVQSSSFKGQLYDLEEDPFETKNLVDEAQHQRLVAELKQKLLLWHIRHAGGYFDTGKAGYWEDRVNFYDETKFNA